MLGTRHGSTCLRKLRQENFWEFEASLGYMVSSRVATGIFQDIVSKAKQNIGTSPSPDNNQTILLLTAECFTWKCAWTFVQMGISLCDSPNPKLVLWYTSFFGAEVELAASTPWLLLSLRMCGRSVTLSLPSENFFSSARGTGPEMRQCDGGGGGWCVGGLYPSAVQFLLEQLESMVGLLHVCCCSGLLIWLS